MASTDHLNCTTQPKLKKLAARTVLAGALGMALMGMTPATANAGIIDTCASGSFPPGTDHATDPKCPDVPISCNCEGSDYPQP